jgi:hypothetical protein
LLSGTGRPIDDDADGGVVTCGGHLVSSRLYAEISEWHGKLDHDNPPPRRKVKMRHFQVRKSHDWVVHTTDAQASASSATAMIAARILSPTCLSITILAVIMIISPSPSPSRVGGHLALVRG